MLTQQELLEKLKDMGTPVTSQTLRTREKQGLVTPAYRGKSGRPGRSVFYADRCLYEHYAAGKMLGSSRLRLTAEQVKDARNEFLDFISNPSEDFLFRPEEEMLDFRLGEYWFSWYILAFVKPYETEDETFVAKIRFCDERSGDMIHDIYVTTDDTIQGVASSDKCLYDAYEVVISSSDFLKSGAASVRILGKEEPLFAFPSTGFVFLDIGTKGYVYK